MRIQKICKICQEPFTAIKTTQSFCKRKCFKRDYYLRTKLKQLDEDAHPVFPSKICSFCTKKFPVPFDPIQFPDLFNDLECPFCHATNVMIWKSMELDNSKQVIITMIASIAPSGSPGVQIDSVFEVVMMCGKH
jgi:hypothetical protein